MSQPAHNLTLEKALNAPWSLHVRRDGTEDIAIICDANDEELVTSRPFWLPDGNAPIPATLAAMQLIAVAPRLLMAAKATLAALELILEVDDPTTYTQAEWQADPMATLKAVIAEAEDAERVP